MVVNANFRWQHYVPYATFGKKKSTNFLSLCTGKTIGAHSEEVWLPVKRNDFRWIRTTSFLVVLTSFRLIFFIKISKSLPNKRYYALTLVEVFRCFPETPCIDKDNLPQTVTNSSCPVYNLSQHVQCSYRLQTILL